MLGETFERLTVVERVENDKHNKKRWRCKCSCGGETVATTSDLRSGNTKSCGCFCKDRLKETKTEHGKCGTSTYNIWKEMVARCTRESHVRWKDYGGRGITVAESWQGKGGFQQFLLDMGERPRDLVLDREDNDKGYCKENCRWVTKSVSALNTRKSSIATRLRVGKVSFDNTGEPYED